MPDLTANVNLDTDSLDDLLEKAKELKDLLEQVKQLLSEKTLKP